MIDLVHIPAQTTYIGSKRRRKVVRSRENWADCLTNHCRDAHKGEFKKDCNACKELQQRVNG